MSLYFENITEFKEYATTNDISNIIIQFRKLISDDFVNNIEIFKKIQKLDCSETLIREIPISFVNLQYLNCSKIQIKEIPKELINLQNHQILIYGTVL